MRQQWPIFVQRTLMVYLHLVPLGWIYSLHRHQALNVEGRPEVVR